MNSVDRSIVLHCLKSMIDEEVCEECPLYGITGTDHCEEDCVRLAINALEQEPVMPVMYYPQVEGITPTVVEPCTDCISRQAVLDLAKFDGRENLGSIIHAFDVEQLPPVKPAEKVGRWIPVSERLPEIVLDEYDIQCSEDVLVYDGANLRVGYFVENNKHDFNYWVVYGDYCFRPIAWMPLPLPYKASPTGADKEG